MFKRNQFFALGFSLIVGFLAFCGPTRATAEPTLTPVAYLPIVSKNWTPYPFALQQGSPTYLPNIANSNGCAWFGMAGQVIDADKRGVVGFFVHVEGGGINVDAPTGSVPKYGTSGWEVTLGAMPLDTTNTYTVELRNGAGQPQSEKIFIPTFNDCNRNHILINFVQVR